jgi:D-threo-aldose 1-dehydrogenase
VDAAQAQARLTELSLGCSQLGNLHHAIDDDAAAATVDAAWDEGVRYFDTAPHYGLGLSERRLGAALASRPRADYAVSTKVGRLLEPLPVVRGQDPEGFAVAATHRRVWDFSRDGVRRSLEDSLQRLGLDRVDIAYLHDPDDHLEQALAAGYPALEELRDEGVVAAIGAGMNNASLLSELARNTDVDLVMLAGRYTLLEQGALDDLLPVCERRGIGVVAAGIFNSGVLARTNPTEEATYDYARAPAEVLDRARRIAAVCERHGTSLPEAAIAFPLGHPAVVSVCVGARSPEQVRRNARLLGAAIPHALWDELREEGLLHPDAPVPRAAECGARPGVMRPHS